MRNEINEIWDCLEQIYKQDQSVSIVKHFVDKTIRVNVTISHISRNQCEIVVVTPQNQDVFYLDDTKILLQSDLFPYPIRARVSSVDINRRSIVLTDLLYPVSMSESRKELRVNPKEALDVRIMYQAEDECLASISDLSVEGVSLIVSSSDANWTDVLVPNESVRLHLSLQTSAYPKCEISFPATVSYINPLEAPEEFRIGFMTFPSEQDKTALRNFIVACQNTTATGGTPLAY
jgi:hypothetical protein